eukprot:338397-Pleurochrysis_carterae.AAC.1
MTTAMPSASARSSTDSRRRKKSGRSSPSGPNAEPSPPQPATPARAQRHSAHAGPHPSVASTEKLAAGQREAAENRGFFSFSAGEAA